MREYIGIYKCRLCGEVFVCGKPYTEDESLKKIVKSSTIFPLFPHDKGYTAHGCKDGSLGIADLQGFKKLSKGD